MPVISQVVDYRDAETPLSGLFFNNDADSAKKPGLLLVHHGSGLDDHAKAHAASYAELGFVVFACDMFGPGLAGNRERTVATLTAFRGDPQALCRRANAGLAILTAHPQFDGRAAAIGYCFGGMTALQLARSGANLTAVVSVHGTLATIAPAEPGAIQGKLLVCHGALDPHVPMPQVNTFIDEMKQSGADWQLIIYGGAMHGFTSKVSIGSPGVAFNEDADRRSSIAIDDFFAEVFGKLEMESSPNPS